MAKSTTRTMTDAAQGRARPKAAPRAARSRPTSRRSSRTGPGAGRKRTPDSIKKRLAAIDTALAEASRAPAAPARAGAHGPAEGARRRWAPKVDLSALEARVREDGRRSTRERKGISYAAWRELGVPADVLKKAGITRG